MPQSHRSHHVPHHRRKYSHHVTHAVQQAKGTASVVPDHPDPPPSQIGWTIAAVILFLVIIAAVVMAIYAVLEPIFIGFKALGSPPPKTSSSSLVRSTPPKYPVPKVSAATRREVGKIDHERERIQAQTALVNAKTVAEVNKMKATLQAEAKNLYLKGKQ